MNFCIFSSVLNPFLYSIVGKDFRQSLAQWFRDRCRARRVTRRGISTRSNNLDYRTKTESFHSGSQNNDEISESEDRALGRDRHLTRLVQVCSNQNFI